MAIASSSSAIQNKQLETDSWKLDEKTIDKTRQFYNPNTPVVLCHTD